MPGRQPTPVRSPPLPVSLQPRVGVCKRRRRLKFERKVLFIAGSLMAGCTSPEQGKAAGEATFPRSSLCSRCYGLFEPGGGGFLEPLRDKQGSSCQAYRRAASGFIITINISHMVFLRGLAPARDERSSGGGRATVPSGCSELSGPGAPGPPAGGKQPQPSRRPPRAPVGSGPSPAGPRPPARPLPGFSGAHMRARTLTRPARQRKRVPLSFTWKSLADLCPF